MPPAAKRAAMLGGALFFIALGTTLWRVDLDRQATALQAAIAVSQAQLKNPPQIRIAAPRGPDFVQRLPTIASVDPIVRELQRSSAEGGVAFLTVSSAPRSPTLQALGRNELSVGLRGTYPKLKSVLAQTLDRFRDLVVQRWRRPTSIRSSVFSPRRRRPRSLSRPPWWSRSLHSLRPHRS